ncbi:MAG TPA: prolyl oligopeptidase family serine peptidase [Phnomibacter sp.]|nr:prolyl oligopeptidase family serine peptidase [Phnomibacter sp.]
MNLNTHPLHAVFFAVLLTAGICAQAQQPPTRQARPVFNNQQRTTAAAETPPDSIYLVKEWVSPSSGDTLKYRMLLPVNYDPQKSYPLILFLHGAGERGSDNIRQLTHGAKLFANPEVRENFPAIVVFPQCPATSYWSNVDIRLNDSTKKREFNFQKEGEPTQAMKMLLQWLPYFEQEYAISEKQRYVMGLSMGGMGTFELVRRRPGYFAAAVPICGGANPETAQQIKETSFWIFHGKMDDVVPYEHSEKMVNALQEFYVRGEVNYTLFPKANHNSWDPAFAEPDLLPWLFNQKKK